MAERTRKHGFTLVELVITVAIVGILAAAAVTLFTDQQLRSKRAEGLTNVEALGKMVRTYYGESGSYPAVNAPYPPPVPTPMAIQWDAVSTTAYGQIGFKAEGAVRYRYDVDSLALAECPCVSGQCFTIVGFSDLEGDGAIGGVALFHPDAGGVHCNTRMWGWAPPLNAGGFPIYDAAVALLDPLAVPRPDDY